VIRGLRTYGIDTKFVLRGGRRLGIYYVEKGASQRPSKVIYDRENSAISEADPSEFDWDAIFEGAEWFHFTGITPALGGKLVEICKDACKAAKARGVKISCDLNYRGKLWTRDQARAAMTELCQYVDVCISNEEDAKDVFGIEAEATDIYAGSLNHEGYKSVAKQLADKFGFEMVAITLRESHSAFDNGWSAMLYNVEKDEYCFSKKYDLHIIDRVGGGDSFGGGLIYSLLTGKDTQAAVEFAVAASALKHSIEGDYNMVTVAEVEKLAGGDGSGRIQR
jgi:2-dehydro-3-deoxygluconokinase